MQEKVNYHLTVVPPLEFKWIYPSGKIFLAQVEKDTLIIIFYVIFIERMYIKVKSKESISWQNWNVYIRAIGTFMFCEFEIFEFSGILNSDSLREDVG